MQYVRRYATQCVTKGKPQMTTINIDHRITKKAATEVVGTLGFPSKMPGTSYGIPAQACHTGAKLHDVPDSVCSDCYALRGNYIFRDVKRAQDKRLSSVEDERWVVMMTWQLAYAHATGKGRNGEFAAGWHRWHDSGDIQSVEHLAKICEVAKRTPQMWHWLPTREMGIVAKYVKQGGVIPENLCIRVSATMVDGPATKAWPTTSTVHHKEPVPTNAHECPAPTQGGKCGSCRACWNRDVPQVSYHKH